MAVKPKRTHGAPRRRRIPQLSSAPALPATPELNEEPNGSGRSISPELSTSQIEPVQSAVVEQPGPAPVPRPTALRKSLPPMSTAASEESAGVPEFMRVQLNRVDSKPSVNVVLSTAGASGPERGSRGSLGVIDPWSVEEVVDVASAPVSLLGLRVKRAVSKDDVAQAGQLAADVPAPVPATVASSVPGTPLKAQPLQKSASASVVPQSLIRKQPPPAKRMLSEDNNNVIIVEKKDKKDTPSPAKASPSLAQEDVAAAARRKSSSRDSLQLQWQSSLEDKEQRSRDSSISPVLDGVVLRKKSLPREGRDARDDTPELMKVFARRSLKVRDSEVELTLSTLAQQSAQGWESNGSSDQTPPQTPPHTPPQVQQRASRDSDKENEGDCGDSPKVERVSASLASRFQRSVSGGGGGGGGGGLVGQALQAQELSPSLRPAPPSEKPAKPSKPVTATPVIGDTVKDNNNSNRLRTRKADNVITNGNVINNINNNNINNNNPEKTPPGTTPVSPAPVSSVVAKMSARWTLPAEAKQTVPAPAPAPAAVQTAADEPEGSPEVGAPASTVPKFKRIQQRKEEWEQRAKALQRATQ